MKGECGVARRGPPLQDDTNNLSFCNFMHLCHPTKSLVSSVHASQRVSRRSKLGNGGGDGPEAAELGWTPGAARSRGPGGRDDGGWGPDRARY